MTLEGGLNLVRQIVAQKLRMLDHNQKLCFWVVGETIITRKRCNSENVLFIIIQIYQWHLLHLHTTCVPSAFPTDIRPFYYNVANKLDSFSDIVNECVAYCVKRKDGRLINMNHNITDSSPSLSPEKLLCHLIFSVFVKPSLSQRSEREFLIARLRFMYNAKSKSIFAPPFAYAVLMFCIWLLYHFILRWKSWWKSFAQLQAGEIT